MTAKTLIPKDHGLRRLLSNDPGQFLLYAVEQVQEQAHYRRVGRVLKQTRRRKHKIGWLHATEALEPCDRYVAARLLNYSPPEEKIDPRLRRIFDNGNFMHLRWQNYFSSLPPSFHVKVEMLVEEWPLVGSADIVVEHEFFGRIVVELKSMNSAEWKGLKAAREDHRNQANQYAGLGRFDGFQVWYENKDTQEVKTFFQPFLPTLYKEGMVRVRHLVGIMLQGQLPPACRPSCSYDSFVADLKLDESRLETLRQERDIWQKS